MSLPSRESCSADIKRLVLMMVLRLTEEDFIVWLPGIEINALVDLNFGEGWFHQHMALTSCCARKQR
jgi:hypothetical protein